jgi:hypothetical protein
MLFQRSEGKTDLQNFDRVIHQISPFAGLGGNLGFDWALATQITGWVISGIGIGISAVQSVRGAKDKSGVETLQESEIQAIAASVAKADPQHRTASQWEQILRGQFGAGAPAPAKCPEGFYPTPDGGCLPIKKAGIFSDVPGWAWIGGGVLAFALFRGKL